MSGSPLHRAAAQISEAAAFDVSSIKKTDSGDTRWNYQMQPGGRFRATRVSLVNLISIAYGSPFPLPSFLVSGGPSWATAERFDVLTKADGNPTQEQVPLMLRGLLADRFKLTVHRETRVREIFVLNMARSDKRLGPELRPTGLDCSLKGDTPPPLATATSQQLCGDRNYPGKLTSPSLTMPVLARLLMLWVEGRREVRDQTGLQGSFQVTLTWTPDRISRQPLDAPAEIGGAIAAIDPHGPSLLTALQEQLGLKLDARKEQVEVVMIDHAEEPTPD